MGASIAGRPGDGGPWPPAVTRALAFEGVVLAVVACGAWATASSRGILAGHALIALSAIACGIGSWGGQRPSLAAYVTVTGPTDGEPAPPSSLPQTCITAAPSPTMPRCR
jgi:hypothetical protein